MAPLVLHSEVLTPFDKCDFIPCQTNAATSTPLGERSRLKYCRGRYLARYCVRPLLLSFGTRSMTTHRVNTAKTWIGGITRSSVDDTATTGGPWGQGGLWPCRRSRVGIVFITPRSAMPPSLSSTSAIDCLVFAQRTAGLFLCVCFLLSLLCFFLGVFSKPSLSHT